MKKKKIQFSKLICLFSMVIVVLTIFLNYSLALFDKIQMSDVTVTSITIFGGFVTGGYFTLSGVRDCSKNKYGIKEEDFQCQQY